MSTLYAPHVARATTSASASSSPYARIVTSDAMLRAFMQIS
ncbi:hypothetical protein [Burkholderia cenocepacia]|nr:hypothetical protein [Burkholderia cenocepacia]